MCNITTHMALPLSLIYYITTYSNIWYYYLVWGMPVMPHSLDLKQYITTLNFQ